MTNVLRKGASGDAVRDLQRLLNALGASPVLKEDEDFGKKTESAVAAFRRVQGLPAGNVADEAMFEAAEDVVRDLQQRLNSLGASPKLDVDGDFGPKTRNALMAFQREHGLMADGRAGTNTTTAMRRAEAEGSAGADEPDKVAMEFMAEPREAINTRPKEPPNPVTIGDTARHIDEIIWHCAATPEGKDFTVADIRAWHRARGSSDIRYHFVVYRDGSVHVGRPIGQVSDHGEGYALGKVECCYIGGVDSEGEMAKDTRTPAQRASMLWLTRALADKFPGIKEVTGHNRYSARACPSFDVQADPLGKIV